MVIEVKVRKWGNSLGVLIPSCTAQKLSLKPNEEIVVEITKKQNVLKELFGAGKFNKTTEEILKEVRRDFESKR
jgi:antitoxin component of MazEF toxin-antitoxin module